MTKQLTVAAFNKLSKSKKAVLVAQDVLDQLKAKKYIASPGKYISSVISKKGSWVAIKGQINEQFDEIQSCEVCALGSMLMSCTHLGNQLTTTNLNINTGIGIEELRNKKVKELFASIFDAKTLLLVETSFEGYWPWKNYSNYMIKYEAKFFTYKESALRYGKNIGKEKLNYEEAYKCEMFKRKYKNETNRLKAICNNLIENKGKFIL